MKFELAINMIVGQRLEQYLKFALESTKWIKEIIIVNTGKEDNPNLGIIRETAPHAKIFNFADTKLSFTFSNARNYALQNTQSYWILWQDADEVHFNDFQPLITQMLPWNHYDGFEFGFYHFLLDMFHYQNIDTRVNIFKREGHKWVGDVHERIEPLGWLLKHDYRYHHYGYTKPQKEIYENWRLYWSLSPDEKFKLQEHRNPDDIITDRVTVAHPYTGKYPEVIQSYLKTQKQKVDNYKFI